MIAIAAYNQGIEELDAGSPGSTSESLMEPSLDSEMSSTIDGDSTKQLCPDSAVLRRETIC